jgi:hypothetical protein
MTRGGCEGGPATVMRATRLSACAYARTGNRDGLGGLLLLQKEPCIALCWPPTACAAKLLLKPCWTCRKGTQTVPNQYQGGREAGWQHQEQ